MVVKNYNQYPFDMYISLPTGSFEFHWKPPSPPKAPDLVRTVSLALEDLLSETTQQLNVTRQRICPVCGGTGALSQEHSHTCKVCEGRGWHLYLKEISQEHGGQSHDSHHGHGHGGKYRHVINKTCEYCDVRCSSWP